MNQVAFERMCIDTIRFLAVDAVEKAKSGHPGTPMGAAPISYVLYEKLGVIAGIASLMVALP